MRTFQDYVAYNTQAPAAIAPKAPKPMPFPLENFDSEIGEAYAKMIVVLTKLEAAEANPVNNTEARKARLESLKHKTESCLRNIQLISQQVQDLWI